MAYTNDTKPSAGTYSNDTEPQGSNREGLPIGQGAVGRSFIVGASGRTIWGFDSEGSAGSWTNDSKPS